MELLYTQRTVLLAVKIMFLDLVYKTHFRFDGHRLEFLTSVGYNMPINPMEFLNPDNGTIAFGILFHLVTIFS